jgi:hypothetical protein
VKQVLVTLVLSGLVASAQTCGSATKTSKAHKGGKGNKQKGS